MSDVTKFYIWAHIFISFTGALLLLAIWYNINKRFKKLLEEDGSKKRVDKGLLYLSLAIFIWVISGCWAYLGNLLAIESSVFYQTITNLCSIANDFFLLLALSYSDYAPQFIYKHEKNISKIGAVVLLMGILTCILPVLLGSANEVAGLRIHAIPDFILSGFLAFLLLLSFYRTFVHRGLKLVAIVSSIVIALIFVSILPDVFYKLNENFISNLVKIIAKTSFISITLVMATSWVIELANTPQPNEMMIKFMDWSLIKLSIPSKGIFDSTIEFGSKTTQYKNILKFAIRRKYGNEPNQSILIGGQGEEIKNQSYLTRIIDNMNEILKLEEDRKLERKDIFTFIGQGKYRLRMIPENIHIDETLLKEFINSTENQEYKSICNSL